MNTTVKIFLVVILSGAIFLISAGKIHTDVPHENTQSRSLVNKWNKHAVDSAISLLKSGDIVLRTGNGAISQMLAQMNQKDKSYSHCGIVIIEQGYPFVYHAIGGEDNPDERLRRDSANRFFSPLNNDGIAIVSYDMDDAATEALKKTVLQYYKARPKFDMKFDLATDDALYCSEFVYKALNKATNNATFITPTHAMGHTFVGIDDLFMNGHARFVCRIKFK